MLKKVGRKTQPQAPYTEALAQRLVEVVKLVGNAEDCTELNRLLFTKGYTDGSGGKWTYTPSGKHHVTSNGAVLALVKPLGEEGPWRAYDLNEEPLGIRDRPEKYPILIPAARKKILVTSTAQVLVEVIELIKKAEDPKKLYEDVLKVIVARIET